MAPTRKKCDWENSKAWGAYKSSKMIYTVKFWTYPISMTNYQIFIYSAKLSTIIYIIPTIKYSYIVLNYQLSYISSQLSSIHIYIYIYQLSYMNQGQGDQQKCSPEPRWPISQRPRPSQRPERQAMGSHGNTGFWFTTTHTIWLCQNSYGKWPFIVSFPMKNGDFL